MVMVIGRWRLDRHGVAMHAARIHTMLTHRMLGHNVLRELRVEVSR